MSTTDAREGTASATRTVASVIGGARSKTRRAGA
jgi:hypothetical protein